MLCAMKKRQAMSFDKDGSCPNRCSSNLWNTHQLLFQDANYNILSKSTLKLDILKYCVNATVFGYCRSQMMSLPTAGVNVRSALKNSTRATPLPGCHAYASITRRMLLISHSLLVNRLESET